MSSDISQSIKDTSSWGLDSCFIGENMKHCDIYKIGNKIINEDMYEIASDNIIKWELFRNTNIVITGATGLIGSLIVKLLLYVSQLKNIDLKIFAVVRDNEKAKKIFQEESIFFERKLYFYTSDIRKKISIECRADYIIHAASYTASKDFINKPVDVITTTIEGTKNILEFANINKSRSVVYISSMEVYGKLEHELVYEDESGIIDPLAVRNSYSQSKRMAETLYIAYAEQYGVPVKIVRPTLTFGAGVLETDNRVYAQFARAALLGKNIILYTNGMTKRDYIYTSDAVRSIITILLLGKNKNAYNISNPETYTTIYDMAKLVSSFNKNTKIVFDNNVENQKCYADEIHIKLDNKKFNNLNNFKHKNLKEMFKRMITYMKI